MAQLFVDAFLEPLEEPALKQPEPVYDERRALAVLPDGRVYVEHTPAGETQTVTKAMGEHDNRVDDRGAQVLLDGGTRTSVRGEADDWAASGKDTETVTLVDSEGVDWAPLSDMDTLTRIRGEADDWAS